MSEEYENMNLSDFPILEDDDTRGKTHGHTRGSSQNTVQDTLHENEEESSGANDYPEGISGSTPPKVYRIDKLYKAKTDRKTTKKQMHKSHSASKLSKKEQRPSKSKSMVELPLSPDVTVSHQKQRHLSIPTLTTDIATTSDNVALHREEKSVTHQSQSSPDENKTQIMKESPLQAPLQSSMKKSDTSMKKELSTDALPFQPHSASNPWQQKFAFHRRSSVDASPGFFNMVSRTSSSPSSSSLRLIESLNDYGMKPRSLNLLSVHVDQDDRLDYGLPKQMKPGSLSQHRHTSSLIPECPRERNEFYSHLHMTVLHLGITGAVARRQPDAEETFSTKESIHQSISMQLRAYLQSRSVKNVSDDLGMKRFDVDKIINDVLDFVLPGDEWISKELFRPFSVRESYAEISVDSNDGLETINEEDSNSESLSADHTIKTDKEDSKFKDGQFMTTAQARAMERVKEVLDALDKAESLYHSLAEMGDDHPKYRSLEFIRRVEALQLWVRITETLASKLCVMSQLCGIRVDLEPGEDDVCLQSLNSSRISWSAMEIEQTRTSCCEKKYRDFVDKNLKKYGLEKMMGMVRKLLANALLMARYVHNYEI